MIKGMRFEVRQMGGVTESFLVDGTMARIGHAAHCDVRLAVDQADAEHITIQAVGDELELMVLATPAPLVDGVKLTGGRSPSGSTLVLAGVPITVTAISVHVSTVAT